MRKSTQRPVPSRRTKKNEELTRRLAEAEEFIDAIRSGHVDAVVVTGPHGDQVYTLRDAARPYQVIVDEMNEGALTLTTQGVILYANSRLLQILQRQMEQVLGEPFARFLAPGDQSLFKDLLSQDVESVRRCELSLAVTEQITVPVSLSMKLVVLENVPRISALVSDITERKMAEAKIQEYLVQLEQRVAERTAQLQLSLEQERASRTELEATNKELEALTYAVSHDLRAPLNQIEQISRLLASEYGMQLPEHAQELIRLIHVNSSEVNCLAEDLLTLTHVQQQTIARRVVSVPDLVREVLSDFQKEIARRSVEITIGALPAASADPLLLKQVWTNLVSNAVKFTRHEANAKIEIGSFQDLGRTVYFVKDNGAGFDMMQSDRLFRAFQRLHHPEDFEGNGLGLAIVERIVRRHGGRAWAQGQEGQGATFYFTLG